MAREWLGILLVLAAFAVLLGGLAVYRRLGRASAEMLRKLLHVGMGGVILSFPWVFHRAWPVLLLSALFVLLFLARKLLARPTLARAGVSSVGSSLADVLDGVGRSSYGEIYFVVSVAVLFVAARTQPAGSPPTASPIASSMLFVIPMLLLTLPDAVAALIGGRYGQHRYFTTVGQKSAEGSIAFVAVAVMAVHVPLLLCTAVGRAESLLIAVTLGLLAMILEAIAWRGLDNLFVPLGAFILLKGFGGMGVGQLIDCAAVAAACLVFSLLWRGRATLDGGAALGAALVLYVAWALGGWAWLLPPVATFVGYSLLWPRTEREREHGHNLQAVASVAAAGLVWVFFKQTTNRPGSFYFYPYTLGFAAHVAIIGVSRLCRTHTKWSAPAVLGYATAAGWVLVFVPYLLAVGVTRRTVLLTVAALPVVASATVLFYATQPGVRDCPVDFRRWVRQGSYAIAASVVGLLSLRWV